MPEENYPRDGAANGPDGLTANRPQLNREMAQGCQEGPPPPPRRDKPRMITITAQDHGFVVQVGCQSFAVEKVSTLIRNLEKYLEKPDATESKWLKGELDL